MHFYVVPFVDASKNNEGDIIIASKLRSSAALFSLQCPDNSVMAHQVSACLKFCSNTPALGLLNRGMAQHKCQKNKRGDLPGPFHHVTFWFLHRVCRKLCAHSKALSTQEPLRRAAEHKTRKAHFFEHILVFCQGS